MEHINGGDRTSLKYLQERYGITEGEKRYSEIIQKKKMLMVGKPSPMKGKKHSLSSKKEIAHSVSNSEYHTSLRKNGLSEDEKKRISICMQGVFSLEWFIKKHGEIRGTELYNQRRKQIAKTSFFRKYNQTNQNNFSKKSQKLFWEIYRRLNLNNKKVYFAELNHEFGCGTNQNFDFVFLDRKKVIEFNGNFWHGNPRIFEENENPIPFKNITAKQIWEADKKKNQKAIDNGYEVLVIWEDEYDQNKKEAINKCIDFILQ